jgi:hypothetical protein
MIPYYLLFHDIPKLAGIAKSLLIPNPLENNKNVLEVD